MAFIHVHRRSSPITEANVRGLEARIALAWFTWSPNHIRHERTQVFAGASGVAACRAVGIVSEHVVATLLCAVVLPRLLCEATWFRGDEHQQSNWIPAATAVLFGALLEQLSCSSSSLSYQGLNFQKIVDVSVHWGRFSTSSDPRTAHLLVRLPGIYPKR